MWQGRSDGGCKLYLLPSPFAFQPICRTSPENRQLRISYEKTGFLWAVSTICKSISNSDELFAGMRAILLTLALLSASNREKGNRGSRQNHFGSLHKVVLMFPTYFSPHFEGVFLAC